MIAVVEKVIHILDMKGGTVMATSSIYDKVTINDPKVAEAFVRAIEESENYPHVTEKRAEIKMATSEETIRLHEMRKSRRANAG